MISRKILVLLAGAALGLSACASTTDSGGVTDPGPLTSTERFPIEVKPQAQELRLAPHAAGLSSNQAAALTEFARTWAGEEGGEVTIQSPQRAGGDPGAAYRTTSGARDVLIAEGVPPGHLRMTGYDAGGDPQAPVIVGYMRYHAQGPECGREWKNMADTYSNREWDNYGCAVTANMAAQIANPADLLAPRDSDPTDAGRRQTVLDHYRKGEVTSSAKDEQASGAVSRAVP